MSVLPVLEGIIEFGVMGNIEYGMLCYDKVQNDVLRGYFWYCVWFFERGQVSDYYK